MMSRKFFRLTTLLLLVFSSLAPAAITAQDSTPDVSPVASPVTVSGVEGAVAWLIDQQQEDGSWLGFSGEPDAGTTIDAVLALAAADEAGIDVGDSIDLALGWLDTAD